MPQRIESPSSLNTFKQCPRKYYYQYIEELPTKENIYSLRGNIVHNVLEKFYTLDPSILTEDNYKLLCKRHLQILLVEEWKLARERLQALKISDDSLAEYFEESMMMVLNWCDHFIEELTNKSSEGLSIEESFQAIIPQREVKYCSEHYGVRGVIDAIKNVEGDIHIIDYKTSSRAEIKDEFLLQLAIYALLYYEHHGILPKRAGIFFLRDTVHMLDMEQDLIEKAKQEMKYLRTFTQEHEKKEDYLKHISPLCKWNGGQCDFFGVCKPF